MTTDIITTPSGYAQIAQKAAGLSLQPREVLENARGAARLLGEVLQQKPYKVVINKEQYLEFEDWQTVGQFYGYTVKTYNAVPVEVCGVEGARAEADLIEYHTGLVVGHAEAYCMRDEEKWGVRPKYEWYTDDRGNRNRRQIGEEPVPWYQLASMAQTRAGAKAFRNRLAWVVVLAGFRPTPMEEMPDNGYYGHQPSPPRKSAGPAKGKAEEPVTDLKALQFKNVGEFYTACHKHFKLTKSKVDAEVAEYDLSKPDQRQRAWQTILSVYGQKPPEVDAKPAPEGPQEPEGAEAPPTVDRDTGEITDDGAPAS